MTWSLFVQEKKKKRKNEGVTLMEVNGSYKHKTVDEQRYKKLCQFSEFINCYLIVTAG